VDDEDIEVFGGTDCLRAQQAEDGTAICEICRKAGISEATFYNWRKKYAGLMPLEMKRLRQLEDENGKLKKLVADLSLDRAMLQDVIRRKAWRPSLVALFTKCLALRAVDRAACDSSSRHACLREPR
jgi:putative transposase